MRVRRTTKRINNIKEDSEASNADDDNWEAQMTHLIKQTVNLTTNERKGGRDYFTTRLLVNNRPITFIIDSGSPVSLIPQQKFNNITPIKPLMMEHNDVNNNRIKFVGKTTAQVEADRKRVHLDLFITKK